MRPKIALWGCKTFSLEGVKTSKFCAKMSRNQGLEATLSFGVPPNRKVPCSWGFRASGRTKKGRNESLKPFEKVGAKMSPAWPGRAREGTGGGGGGFDVHLVHFSYENAIYRVWWSKQTNKRTSKQIKQ